MDHQYHFFEQLQMHFASRQAMVTEVASTLGLSKDAIYRRLRGTTVLSTNELVQLAHHYGVRLSNPDDAHYFAFNHAETVIRSPGDYLAQLTDRLTKIQRLSNLFIYLANPGLPFFHEMVYPRLFAFKLFIYGSTCWNFPGWRDRKFSVDLIDRKVLEQARTIGEYSYTIPGRELWTMGMLRATLDQIEYMHITGRFAAEAEAEALLDELESLVQHLESMARHGRKFLPGSSSTDGPEFFPAHNEVANNDNVILIDSDQISSLFVTFITPNFLQTEEPIFCDLTREWFQGIDSMSSSLGAEAGKYRTWYFNRFYAQLRSTRQRLFSGVESDM